MRLQTASPGGRKLVAFRVFKSNMTAKGGYYYQTVKSSSNPVARLAMPDKRKLRFGPRSLFEAIYDWINTCDSIPNFDGVLISAIVLLLGCLLIGFMYIAGSLSTYRQEHSVQPTLATSQPLQAADGDVITRFGRPRTGAETWHHSPQELFGQASAAPSEE